MVEYTNSEFELCICGHRSLEHAHIYTTACFILTCKCSAFKAKGKGNHGETEQTPKGSQVRDGGGGSRQDGYGRSETGRGNWTFRDDGKNQHPTKEVMMDETEDRLSNAALDKRISALEEIVSGMADEGRHVDMNPEVISEAPAPTGNECHDPECGHTVCAMKPGK